jgi:fused signal recognition particle receptor
MGLFQKLKQGLQKTQARLVHEIRRVVTGSPKLTGATLEELEAALLGADLGHALTAQIISEVKRAYETQGSKGPDILAVARGEVEKCLLTAQSSLTRSANGLTVISIVGVNGTGKTTTGAKLAHLVQTRGEPAMLAACDTFRAAAIEQLKIWGQRTGCDVISGQYNSDSAAIAFDALDAAISRKCDYLLIDTAGRLHTKKNLMDEMAKLQRVLRKRLPDAPHETLLVLDASTGMNGLNQAREFHQAVGVSGLIVTKLDGTAKGGIVVAINRELKISVKFIGVGEQVDDLQPFDAKAFSDALFN